MKDKIISRIIIFFALTLVLWSIVNFFIYRQRDIYVKIPKEIIKEISQNGNSEVILYNQLLDKFILKYPSFRFVAYNEYFRGADSRSGHTFFLLTVDGIPDKMRALSEKKYKIAEIVKKDNFILYRFQDDYPFEEFYLSSNIANLSVSTLNNNVKKSSPMFMTVFKTGSKSWNKLYVSNGKFENGSVKMISAHPIGNEGTYIEINIPPQRGGYSNIYFRHAIALSGRCPNCPPVVTEIVQGDKKVTIKTAAYHIEDTELSGFSADKPLNLKISTANDGKRHFFFDMIYKKQKND